MNSRVRERIVGVVNHRRLWWVAVVVWAGVLWSLSSDSAPPSGPEFPFKDKVAHCLYFSGGAFSFVLALFGCRGAGLKAWRAILCGMAFAAIIGGLDEWHQTFTPGRSGNDPGDWLADISGGLLGAVVAWQVLRRFTRYDRGRWV